MPNVRGENKVVDAEMFAIVKLLTSLGEQVARGNVEPLHFDEEQKQFIDGCIQHRELIREREQQKERFESQLLTLASRYGFATEAKE